MLIGSGSNFINHLADLQLSLNCACVRVALSQGGMLIIANELMGNADNFDKGNPGCRGRTCWVLNARLGIATVYGYEKDVRARTRTPRIDAYRQW
jgi:hypothetical protein